jgi:hypothetical protein
VRLPGPRLHPRRLRMGLSPTVNRTNRHNRRRAPLLHAPLPPWFPRAMELPLLLRLLHFQRLPRGNCRRLRLLLVRPHPLYRRHRRVRHPLSRMSIMNQRNRRNRLRCRN